MDFAILHETLHTLGFVPSCAPHQTRAGHTSDDPTDIMWAGDGNWDPSVLDYGHDDYFNANVPGCLDLADSSYLQGGPPLRRHRLHHLLRHLRRLPPPRHHRRHRRAAACRGWSD